MVHAAPDFPGCRESLFLKAGKFTTATGTRRPCRPDLRDDNQGSV